ncbi:PREDICTED: uncharacterized protein LOC105561081 [Vollenhovia emeryi]|uniref:uncharacterized protein LOC105561081 n=1 Tax=Vollenhovia emeryi TaxID=411798 RepID=UPI0005F482E8|nr:PREDICTED: uncharacterized protein LOC105561081 [Vollenhovia emeryi]
MSPPSRRENAVTKEPVSSTVVAKNKPEAKAPVISYDYEAAISQPDVPKVYSKIDDDTQNASWSEPSDESSAPTKRRDLYVFGKASVTTKKRGIAFKSKMQAKKVTKTRPSICNVAEIESESIPSSEIIRDVENHGQEISDDIVTNRQTPSNFHQVRFGKIFLSVLILQLIRVIFRKNRCILETLQRRESQKKRKILRAKLPAYFQEILIKLIKPGDRVSLKIGSAKFRA